MKEFSYKISFIRIFALVMVIGLHILQPTSVDTDYFPWFTGVPLFLIISGYLFGQVTIKDTFTWYKKRIIRVWIPFILFFFINICFTAYFKQIPSYLNIVKGFFAFPSCDLNSMRIGHCWYVTYIMFLYLLTPLLKRIFTNDSTITSICKLLCVLILELCFCQFTAYTPFYGKLSFPHIWLYTVSFFISNRVKFGRLRYSGIMLFILIGTVATIFTRLILMKVSGALYSIIHLFEADFASLAVFGLFVALLSQVNWKKVINNKLHRLITNIDHYSFYAYLTHYWFVNWGWFSVFSGGINVGSLSIFFVSVIMSTLLFGYVSEIIISKVKSAIL